MTARGLTVPDIAVHGLTVLFQPDLDPSRVLPIARVTLFDLISSFPQCQYLVKGRHGSSARLDAIAHLVHRLQAKRAAGLGNVETLRPPERFLPGHPSAGGRRGLCIKVDGVDRVPPEMTSKAISRSAFGRKSAPRMTSRGMT